MDIFYFERMRVFTVGDGRIILKLRLPRCEADGFNRLYLDILKEVITVCEGLSERGISGTVTVGAREVSSGEFKLPKKLAARRENLIIIERTHSARLSPGEYNNRYIDIYDIGRDILVK